MSKARWQNGVVPLHDKELITFASDNYAGVHPAVLAALAEANGGHVPAYGDDPYSTRLTEKIKEVFGESAEIFQVFNGTGANVLGLTAMLPRWGAVICSTSAHIHTDEAGAPEKITGLKLYPVEAKHAKLTPELIATEAHGFGSEHRAQPLVVSITQTTELGTLYSLDEIREIADYAHSRGMLLHMDGARIWNAAAALGVSLRELTTDVGVDVLSFGGTKIGAMAAEGVVVLNPEAAKDLRFLRKSVGQLGSKLRFTAAQYLALFEDDLGLKNGKHANEMGALLRGTLEKMISDGKAPGLAFTNPTEANVVFATLPREAIDRLRIDYHFYDWDESSNEVRWMTAFDTKQSDILGFCEAVSAALLAA